VRRAIVLGALLLFCGASAAAAQTPPFRGTVSPLPAALRRAMTGSSWHAGCPVGLDELRLVRARYRGFDGRVHTGRLVVDRDVALDVLGVLRRLYEARFPIRRMVPVDAYGASDFRSIEADNTSAFNCRYVDGTTRWSEHAYGREPALPPPLPVPPGHGGRGRRRRARVRRSRLRLGRTLVGRPRLPALLGERPLTLQRQMET
jgi:hypothetical protein